MDKQRWMLRQCCSASHRGQTLMLEAVGKGESAGGIGNREQWGLVRDAELVQVCASKVSQCTALCSRQSINKKLIQRNR